MAALVAAVALAPPVTFAQAAAPAAKDKAPAKLASGDQKFVTEALKHGA
jgi:hypothetical protein